MLQMEKMGIVGQMEKMEIVGRMCLDGTISDSTENTESLQMPSIFSKIRKSEMHRSKSIGFFTVIAKDARFLGAIDPPPASSKHSFAVDCDSEISVQNRSTLCLQRSMSSPSLQKARQTYNRAIGKDLPISSGKRVVYTENDLRILDYLLLSS